MLGVVQVGSGINAIFHSIFEERKNRRCTIKCKKGIKRRKRREVKEKASKSQKLIEKVSIKMESQ